ncbi:hemolysin-like protein (plasmid) [Phaeobacter inhibens]|uniref:calcium-binding protein n=1 Tax=Phaeobacter inhibens TaxID=221822 RepID=UPI000C9CF608|nr:calcium-binding protein [Phaeobacter inhibens]AUQ92737.1 hemolysin-like protein [Phaeobacter inhibens]
MANITLGTGVTLVSGTENDDAVTADRALDFATGEDMVGNGGADTLTLNNNALAALFGNTDDVLSYDANTDTWTIDDDDQNGDNVLLTEGFTTVTFSDGVTIEAGVASSGVTELGAASGNPLDAQDAVAYDWTGSALSNDTTALGDFNTLVSINGVAAATAGTSLDIDDGTFTIAGTSITFTATEDAIAAQGNVGDTASFSYDAVIADADGNQQTVTLNYTATIALTAGDDTWVASEGNKDQDETATAGGDDTFTGDAQDNIIVAAAGNDTLTGGDGVDNLTGGAGDDLILGENGDDVIDANGGNDTVRGGNGDDVITATAGAATDSNTLGGGAGSDQITGGDGDDVIFGGNGDDDQNNGLVGGAGNDVINGGEGGDLLSGGTGNDTLKGGDGNDTLNGDSGSNELRGGAGKDDVNGGTNDDVIFSSLGGDDLAGGGGDDTFVLKTGTGTTTIEDFNAGDILNISQIANGNVLDILANAYETSAGGNSMVVITLDADTTVILENTALTDIAATAFSDDALA